MTIPNMRQIIIQINFRRHDISHGGNDASGTCVNQRTSNSVQLIARIDCLNKQIRKCHHSSLLVTPSIWFNLKSLHEFIT